MAIDKLIQYDSHPDATGEALVHPANASLEKTASSVHPDVQAYLDNAPSPPGDMMRLLITALSSFDTFGPNKNGDGFYRDDLVNEINYGPHPESEGNLVIPMHKSFEHFARPYMHHINSESSPAYGEIERSIFNPEMDRVELIALLDTAKAPSIARQIENYEPTSTSMGFRAAWDTCSACHNKAKSRREYCDHLKNHMLEVRPDGHIIHARNPKGKFFDISFVGTPADGTSRAVYVGRLPTRDGTELGSSNPATGDINEPPEDSVHARKDRDPVPPERGEDADSDDEREDDSEKAARRRFAKAARVSFDRSVTPSAQLAEEQGLDGSTPLSWRKAAESAKNGESRKRSAIDKRVDGEIEEHHLDDETEEVIQKMKEALYREGPVLTESQLREWAKYPVDKAASTAAMAGISLRPEEMQYLALTKSGAPHLARRLYENGMVIHPEGPPEKNAQALEIGPSKTLPRLWNKIAADTRLLEARSLRYPHLAHRMKALGGPSNEKSAAMGPNPYLRHRRPITPQEAEALATQHERDQIRRRAPERMKDAETASVLEYLVHLLAGTEWNQGKMPRRSDYQAQHAARRGPRPGPASRAAQIQQGAPSHQGSMMTMPLAHYVRGTNSVQPVYDQSGIVESAMSKESSLRAWARNHLEETAEAYRQMDKIASEQVGFILDDPAGYSVSQVDAAALRSVSQMLSTHA